MRICLALFCVFLLQGATTVNAQSGIMDSIMSGVRTAVDMYNNGQIIPTARSYVSSAIDLMNRMQSALQSSAPSGQGRSGASPPQMPQMPQMPHIPQMPRPQWPWVMPPSGK